MTTIIPRTPPRGGHAIHAKPRGFTAKRVLHDPQGLGDDPHVAADLALTKRIAETLERHYPAHPWMVSVSHATGIAQIKLPIVMQRNQAYVLHISRLNVDPALRAVIRAGGELLERYRMPRANFRLDPFLDARENVPMNKLRKRLILPN